MQVKKKKEAKNTYLGVLYWYCVYLIKILRAVRIDDNFLINTISYIILGQQGECI